MRVCKDCGKTAETEEQLKAFVKHKPSKYGRKNRCKKCQRKYVGTLKDGIREFIAELKDVPCTDCGNRYPTVAMDFDHVRGKKLFGLAFAACELKSKRSLLAEAAKCEVVCANCHRIRTFS